MVEALCGVIHDNRGVLHHGVGEAIDLASGGGNFPFAFRWVCCRVGGFDCIAVHGGYVRASEVPADTNDAALEPVCCVNSTARRANHIAPIYLPSLGVCSHYPTVRVLLTLKLRMWLLAMGS